MWRRSIRNFWEWIIVPIQAKLFLNYQIFSRLDHYCATLLWRRLHFDYFTPSISMKILTFPQNRQNATHVSHTGIRENIPSSLMENKLFNNVCDALNRRARHISCDRSIVKAGQKPTVSLSQLLPSDLLTNYRKQSYVT